MKVKELINKLKETDPEREVVMSKDSEGNSHSPLYGFWEGSYVPETTWYGEVYNDSMEGDPDPEDVRIPGEGGAVAAIVLQPVN
jgi:hypothetical protein